MTDSKGNRIEGIKPVDNTVFNNDTVYEIPLEYTFTETEVPKLEPVNIVGFPLGRARKKDLLKHLPDFKKVYVNGCGVQGVHNIEGLVRKDTGFFRSHVAGNQLAHTHICSKDKVNRYTVCFASEDMIFEDDDTPSVVAFHEYAHILDPSMPRVRWIECRPNNMHVAKTVADKKRWDAWDHHGEPFKKLATELYGPSAATASLSLMDTEKMFKRAGLMTFTELLTSL